MIATGSTSPLLLVLVVLGAIALAFGCEAFERAWERRKK